jgi:indolepyruvate decarboxylase
MSCTELSTIVARGLNPIVFVLNNHGYTTERFLLDGPFNDIANWSYHRITEMIGGGIGCQVSTEGELETAIANALQSDKLNVISVEIGSKDISPALLRMTDGLAKRV